MPCVVVHLHLVKEVRSVFAAYLFDACMFYRVAVQLCAFTKRVYVCVHSLLIVL